MWWRNHGIGLKARSTNSSGKRRAAHRGGSDQWRNLPERATFARRNPSHRNAGRQIASHPRQSRIVKVRRNGPKRSRWESQRRTAKTKQDTRAYSHFHESISLAGPEQTSHPLKICAPSARKLACPEQARTLQTPHTSRHDNESRT